jgi:phosphatidylglycerophosphate synthase
VRTVQRGPLVAFLTVAGLLAALGVTVGLGPPGLAVGLGCGALLAVGLAAGMHRHSRDRLLPADRVTLVRAALSCAVAALVADAWGSSPARNAPLVGLAAIALVLDGVDGWVARRTGAVTPFGARFDMEADAFLILVLSVYVARSSGVWVMGSGLARYALLVTGLAVPWLARPTPPRYWAKVVAAIQGIVLVLAAAEVLPPRQRDWMLAVAVLLIAESFGRQVWWLRRQRDQAAGRRTALELVPAERGKAA